MTRTVEEIRSYNVSILRQSAKGEVYKICTLGYLFDEILTDPRLKNLIETLRGYEYQSSIYKFFKRTSIPAYTISCACEDWRNTDYIVSRNPLICLDIDLADNKDKIGNMEQLIKVRDALFTWSCCYAAGTSCSGRGIFLIVALESNESDEEFVEYFNALSKDFADNGIVIDKQCKDVIRLRIASSDEVLVKKEPVECYGNRLPTPKPAPRVVHPMPKTFMGGLFTDFDLICEIIEMLIERGYSTDTYGDWLQCAFHLQPLGGKGLDFMLRISRQSSGYKNDREVEKKFNKDTINSQCDFSSACAYFCSIAKSIIGPGYYYEAQERLATRFKNNNSEQQ